MLVADPTGNIVEFSHNPEYGKDGKDQPAWVKNATSDALYGPCLDGEESLSSATNQKR